MYCNKIHEGFPHSSVGKEWPAMQETPVLFLGWEDPWRRDRPPTPVFLDFPCGSAGKEFTCNVEDLGSISGLGRSPGQGRDYPLQYSGQDNSMDYIVHGVTNSQTTERLSSHFTRFMSTYDTIITK